MSYVEIGVPEDYQGLSSQEKVSCLQNRHRISAEQSKKKFTPDPLVEKVQQMEERFKKANPEAYVLGLKVVLKMLANLEADGNSAARDMAVVARGKLARVEHEEGLKEECDEK